MCEWWRELSQGHVGIGMGRSHIEKFSTNQQVHSHTSTRTAHTLTLAVPFQAPMHARQPGRPRPECDLRQHRVRSLPERVQAHQDAGLTLQQRGWCVLCLLIALLIIRVMCACAGALWRVIILSALCVVGRDRVFCSLYVLASFVQELRFVRLCMHAMRVHGLHRCSLST